MNKFPNFHYCAVLPNFPTTSFMCFKNVNLRFLAKIKPTPPPKDPAQKFNYKLYLRGKRRKQIRAQNSNNICLPKAQPITLPQLRCFPSFGHPAPLYNPYQTLYVSEILRIPPPPDVREIQIIPAGELLNPLPYKVHHLSYNLAKEDKPFPGSTFWGQRKLKHGSVSFNIINVKTLQMYKMTNTNDPILQQVKHLSVQEVYQLKIDIPTPKHSFQYIIPSNLPLLNTFSPLSPTSLCKAINEGTKKSKILTQSFNEPQISTFPINTKIVNCKSIILTEPHSFNQPAKKLPKYSKPAVIDKSNPTQNKKFNIPNPSNTFRTKVYKELNVLKNQPTPKIFKSIVDPLTLTTNLTIEIPQDQVHVPDSPISPLICEIIPPNSNCQSYIDEGSRDFALPESDEDDVPQYSQEEENKIYQDQQYFESVKNINDSYSLVTNNNLQAQYSTQDIVNSDILNTIPPINVNFSKPYSPNFMNEFLALDSITSAHNPTVQIDLDEIFDLLENI